MIDYADLLTKAECLRIKLGQDNHSPIDIFSLVQTIEKLTLVFYPMGDTISGMCIKGEDGKCTIAINSSMTLGRQRFSLAHELYHLYYDDNLSSICLKNVGIGNDIEKKADSFAAYFLMPRASLSQVVDKLLKKHKGGLSIEDIIYIEQYFGVSHKSALYQLKSCGYINEKELNKLSNIGVRHYALMMGYSEDLYLPLDENKQYCTYGYYISTVEQLLKKDIISNGKYEELLLEAFRPDLVYGDNKESGEIFD